jgi:hypothetical protein
MKVFTNQTLDNIIKPADITPKVAKKVFKKKKQHQRETLETHHIINKNAPKKNIMRTFSAPTYCHPFRCLVDKEIRSFRTQRLAMKPLA